jgi:hypothetical protein
MILLETLIELKFLECLEDVLLLRSDKELHVEQLEATVSQSAVPSPSLSAGEAPEPLGGYSRWAKSLLVRERAR